VELVWAFENLTPNAIIDIFIVAFLFFGISFLFRGTQAVALFRGTIFLLVGLILISSLFRLQALQWLLQNILTVLAVAIPVIFQPELRRALERLGRGGILLQRQTPETQRAKIIDDVCQAAEKLSERRHGALIVLQRNSSLQEYIRTGVMLNADISPELLLNIFWPKTELHDGAVILDAAGKIASAAAVLPLTASRNLPSPKMGTRHRAALGISEVSDAICVVVSEETGKIAVTNAGRMVSRLDTERLRTILNAFYGTERKRTLPFWASIRDGFGTFIGRWQDWRKRV
jgi:diadenylate cyclase